MSLKVKNTLMNKYDLVLFDLDGTVADTDQMIIETMYTMYDLYRGGKKTPIEEIYYFSGPPIKETLKKEFPHQDNDFMVKEFVRLSWNNYDKYAKRYPYVKEIINILINRGIKVGLVTSKAKLNTIHCLEVIDLKEEFSYFVTSDDVKNNKPDPEGIYLAMKHFSISDKRKVLYIGDNNSDYYAALNAGVDVALVSWGPREINRNNKPNYWLDDYRKLEDIIDGK